MVITRCKSALGSLLIGIRSRFQCRLQRKSLITRICTSPKSHVLSDIQCTFRHLVSVAYCNVFTRSLSSVFVAGVIYRDGDGGELHFLLTTKRCAVCLPDVSLVQPDIIFLNHDSSIFRQSSHPVCGFSMNRLGCMMFGPQRTGLALP